ncbi:MAG: PolC-type DNA polymerase III [Gemmatimonadales bacterium]
MTSGVGARPTGTLVERALEYLQSGPAESDALTTNIMGLRRVPPVVADRLAVALLGADPRVLRMCDGRWALARAGGQAPQLSDCAFAVVDVETTGTSPSRGDRIIEIAVVAVLGTAIEVKYHSLVDPERPVPHFTSAITQITQDMVRGQPTFGEVADDVLAALAGRVFAAHNVKFDWSFVGREVKRARDLILDGPRVCTVALARRLLPGLKSRSLDSVSAYFGVEISPRHRAMGDALATARVLQRLLELADERGVRSLDDLVRLSRRRNSKRRRKSPLPRSMERI